MISSGGGVEASKTALVRWLEKIQRIPIIANIPCVISGNKRQDVRSVILYGAESWPVKVDDLNRLERTD